MFEPKNDGIDHINIYSKGKTELGRLLTNLAPVSFIHTEYGYFECMEAFWHWYLTGMKHDEIKRLNGFQAKKQGQKFRNDREDVGGLTGNQKKELLFAIQCKLNQNIYILTLMKNSELPFAHYYFYGNEDNPKIVQLPQYHWQIEYFEKVRNYLKGF